ncbi:MAG: serine hydrolase domain-containing protein [Candidatus Limnocylindria bacterium]
MKRRLVPGTLQPVLRNARYASKSMRGFYVDVRPPSDESRRPRRRRSALLRPLLVAALVSVAMSHAILSLPGGGAFALDGSLPWNSAQPAPSEEPRPRPPEGTPDSARRTPPARWTEDSTETAAPIEARGTLEQAETAVPPVVEDTTASELAAAVERAYAARGVPGLAVAVTLPDGSSWSGGGGVTDFASGTRVDGDTMFTIASITKTFVAALTLRLVEDGLIGLDDPLSRWVSDFPNADQITVRELLGHTSGVGDFFRDGSGLIPALLRDQSRTWTPEEVLEYAGAPTFAPGRAWAYSNSNYVLLGLVIHEATGTSVGEALRTRVLEPLGLDHTFLQPDEQPRGSVAVGHAQGFDRNGDGRPDPVSAAGALDADVAWISAVWTAGGMASSASDLAAWGDRLFRGGVLEPTSLDAMLNFDSGAEYGLGVQRRTIDGHEALGHTGGLRGYTGLVFHLPREGATVSVLTNQEVTDLESVLTARYGGSRPILDIALSAAAAAEERTEAADADRDAHRQRRLTGNRD